ncbi:MAG: PSD1 and planctomycete cytochrome C domain-containing protein [Verrucomicrobiales bacterium]|nr:PSD1 and planctomycete cytochrome C domain-containing protein [Verrucomicrobiales bacterium]
MRFPPSVLFALILMPIGLTASEELAFFEKKIRPVLAEKCYSCHSADAEKLKGSLQVDHLEHLLAGGETGAAIEPGNAPASLLIESIRYGNEDLQMPPKEKLSDEIVKNFETWINAGAIWPDEPVPQRDGKSKDGYFDLQERYEEHWSWRPVDKSELPSVSDSEWVRQPVDHFILSGIDSLDLRPAVEAEPSAWLRRVYFDLIGLPPTLEQIDAFLNDGQPGAEERVVDELLTSPRFGEKWARHWMDLVRYADTYGHEFDYEIAHSHEYRDYLIRAFNADVPYDQLIREHVAGDLISTPRRHPEEQFNESILGTGFWYFHEATHAPTDVLANEADIMDNQIDVFGKSFLGLTISCARCHDHKFDAISTADYYALTAYLHGSARQDFPLDPQRAREKTRVELEELKVKADREISSEPVPELAEVDADVFEDFNAGVIPEGWSASGFAFAGGGSKAGLRYDEDIPMTVPGTIDSGVFGREQVGVLRSPTFTITEENMHLLLRAEGVDVRLVIDNYQMSKFSGLLFRGTFAQDVDTKGKFKWITFTRDLRKYVGHKAYLEIVDAEDGFVILDEILQSGSTKAPAVPKLAKAPALTDAQKEALTAGLEKIDRLPAPRYAVAMAEGTKENTQVYVRGSHRSLGEEVPPRFLEALGGERGDRLALANQIANPKNPLTSRVMVNRIWHHLFGRGIVGSVDDFGPMGQMPTHPELLDWLATDFVENGWSLKQTVRSLVLSSTYRQSSAPHPDVSPGHLAEVDPNNEMLSRMPVKRLTGEAIRDSILAVSGRLDEKRYGLPVPTHRTAFMTGRGGRDSGPLDGDARRSIYGAVYRNFLSPFMLTFDVPSPFGPKGRRSVSNVPAQALVLMNDPFVVEQSRLWGEKVAAEDGAETEKLDAMYLEALGREPVNREREKILSFLNESEGDPLDRWAQVAHVLINTKEFIFIP